MAEETPTTPAPAAEPPKADPLAKPAAATASPLGQPIKRPVVGGAGALKPGLKLPPKPGLAPGLKLPPKPVSPLKTVSAASPLKPGLKMPAAPALKSGLKLPTKPVIRKPGAGLSPVKPIAPRPAAPAAAAPAPAAPAPVPAAPVDAAPAPAPAAPVAAAPAPAASVAAAPAPTPAAPVVKPVAVAGDALATLKTVTKNLKSLTSPIPQQAILHKTGIIADPGAAPTEAQKQAAKSKTSRISLSAAVGAAPVKNDGAPMKTIRIKRPVDLPADGPATAKTATAQIVGAPSSPKKATAKIVAPPSVAGQEPPAKEAASSATQRKTLKITRPGGAAVRPAGKFGIKKPGTAPAAPAAAPAADASVADIPDIPDIPQMPTNVAAFPAAPAAGDTVADVPAFVATLGLLVQAAACVAMGALMWFLYQDCQIPLF